MFLLYHKKYYFLEDPYKIKTNYCVKYLLVGIIMFF